jgi:protein-S-isoprenylcysteine O-methyltransferase Ste14
MSRPPSPGLGARLPSLGPRGEGWLLLQLVLIGAVGLAGAFSGANWTGALRLATSLAAAALLVVSMALAFLGLRDLDQSFSPLPMPTDDAALIEHGVYRRLRHPIYTGVMLGALGWGLLTASLLACMLAIVLMALLDLKARREESWLRDRYPGYGAYAARTRRFLPGLY